MSLNAILNWFWISYCKSGIPKLGYAKPMLRGAASCIVTTVPRIEALAGHQQAHRIKRVGVSPPLSIVVICIITKLYNLCVD